MSSGDVLKSDKFFSHTYQTPILNRNTHHYWLLSRVAQKSKRYRIVSRLYYIVLKPVCEIDIFQQIEVSNEHIIITWYWIFYARRNLPHQLSFVTGEIAM